eukprot:1411894-Pyramimonas_sp.AAC.1
MPVLPECDEGPGGSGDLRPLVGQAALDRILQGRIPNWAKPARDSESLPSSRAAPFDLAPI